MSAWAYHFARAQRVTRAVLGSLVVSFAAACDDYGDDYAPTEPPPPSATVVSASGAITAKVDEFRQLIGDPRNGGTVPGPAPSGRREVTWDGVQSPNLNTNAFPGDFFHVTTKLGLITATPGVGQRVSDNDFADVNAAFGESFNAFSGTKTFAAVGNTVMDVTFRVAAGTAAAVVSAFGVVFADVDVAGATRIEAFDKAGKSLGVFQAPVRSDGTGHSFVGIKFPSAIIARIRITSGTGALGAQAQDVTNGGATDLVVMDDFIYAEPIPQ